MITTITRETKMIRLTGACLAISALLGADPAAANEGLYEDITILGSLDCELDASVHLLTDERRAIRCDFESASVRDNLNRYFVTLTGVDGGSSAGGGEVLSWTVVRLSEDVEAVSSRASVSGSYVRILPSVAEQYGLDETALIGGLKDRIALEPRSGDRSNSAGAISSLDISF